jgi:hypothetical protein
VYLHSSVSGKTCEHKYWPRTRCAQVEINDSLKARSSSGSCAWQKTLPFQDLIICGLDYPHLTTAEYCTLLHNYLLKKRFTQDRYDAWVRIGSLSSLLHLSGCLMSLVQKPRATMMMGWHAHDMYNYINICARNHQACLHVYLLNYIGPWKP